MSEERESRGREGFITPGKGKEVDGGRRNKRSRTLRADVPYPKFSAFIYRCARSGLSESQRSKKKLPPAKRSTTKKV